VTEHRTKDERVEIVRCPRCGALPRPTLMGRTICRNCGTDVHQPAPAALSSKNVVEQCAELLADGRITGVQFAKALIEAIGEVNADRERLRTALERIAQYCGNRGAAVQSVAHMAREALKECSAVETKGFDDVPEKQEVEALRGALATCRSFNEAILTVRGWLKSQDDMPEGAATRCFHPVLIDNKEQPGVAVYVCARCDAIVRLYEYTESTSLEGERSSRPAGGAPSADSGSPPPYRYQQNPQGSHTYTVPGPYAPIGAAPVETSESHPVTSAASSPPNGGHDETHMAWCAAMIECEPRLACTCRKPENGDCR
jgi:rRNA maturation protein Nop10